MLDQVLWKSSLTLLVRFSVSVYFFARCVPPLIHNYTRTLKFVTIHTCGSITILQPAHTKSIREGMYTHIFFPPYTTRWLFLIVGVRVHIDTVCTSYVLFLCGAFAVGAAFGHSSMCIIDARAIINTQQLAPLWEPRHSCVCEWCYDTDWSWESHRSILINFDLSAMKSGLNVFLVLNRVAFALRPGYTCTCVRRRFHEKHTIYHHFKYIRSRRTNHYTGPQRG